DVDGDGQDEVITGLDTNHHQLIIYRLDGDILWEADLGAAATAVDVGPDTVIAGAACGSVSAFAAAEGHRRWCAFLGQPVASVIARPNCTAAQCDNGALAELDDTGKLQRVSAPAGVVRDPVQAKALGEGVLLVTNQKVSYFV
ncbi:MAG: hypothetical protein HOM68_05040, partial [Gemmatimonadetes bacterium]|nr:hypothetical protein [Gemmatimonadota bacterium]